MVIMYANQVFTKVILREVTSMEKALLITLTIERIKENGQMGYSQVTEYLVGQMVTDMKASIEMD